MDYASSGTGESRAIEWIPEGLPTALLVCYSRRDGQAKEPPRCRARAEGRARIRRPWCGSALRRDDARGTPRAGPAGRKGEVGEAEEEAVMTKRRLTMDEAPERFSYAKGDRVARVREDGQPDVSQSGVIAEGVFEESASNVGGGSYDVVYTIR